MTAVPAKFLHVLALLGKIESPTGTPATLAAASNGLQMQFDDVPNAVIAIEYLKDGDIGRSMGALGSIARVAPQGRVAKSDGLPFLLRLPGSAYSVGAVPNIHGLLQAAGLDAAIDTSSGAEKVTYTPTAAGGGYAAMTFKAYERGEVQQIDTALLDLKIQAPDTKPPKFIFPMRGIANLPADASPVLPSGLVFPNASSMPLPNVGLTFKFGNFTTNAIIKSWEFNLNREFTDRTNFNGASNAFAGPVPGMRRPELKFQIEATALEASTPWTSTSGFNPYQLLDVGTQLGETSVQIGSVQYNKLKLALLQSQVVDVVKDGEGKTATYTITVRAHCSSPTANDDISIVCA